MTHILQLQDAIPDRYSPDMEAQRIFDKMFDVDSKKSMYGSPRCGYDIDTSDGDDKPYPQVTVVADADPSTSVEASFVDLHASIYFLRSVCIAMLVCRCQ